jgi:hypothetical protein
MDTRGSLQQGKPMRAMMWKLMARPSLEKRKIVEEIRVSKETDLVAALTDHNN